MPYPHPARHLTASLAAPPRVDAISVRGNNPHRVALRSRSGGAARSHSRSIARVRSIAKSKAMTTQSRSELASPPHGRISIAGDDGMVPLQTRSSPGRTRRSHPGRGESRGEQYLVARNGNRSHKGWHDGDATCARERGSALYPASGRSRRGRLRLQVIGHPEPAGQPMGGEGSAEPLHGDAESLMDGISSSWRSAAARRNWVSAADRSPTRSARRPSPS